jgi:hypothetical protein
MEITSRAASSRGSERILWYFQFQGIAEFGLPSFPNTKAETGYLTYPVSVRDTAKSGMGCRGNHHLNDLAESIAMNVGGLYPDAKDSSRPIPGRSVGAAIVVRGWESQPHAEHRQQCSAGEGPQSVGTSRAKVAKC